MRLFVFCSLLWGFIQAQSVPAPGPAQTIPLILRNVTVHHGDGKVSEKVDILIENGIITQIGKVEATFKQATDIDLTGKHVYPGMITMNSILGLQELELVRATADAQETGNMNPGARSLVAYNTDSRITPTVRANGVLIAQLAPRGGLFSGTSAVVQLDAWNYEDAALRADEGVYLNMPPASGISQSVDAAQQMDLLHKTLRDAIAYAGSEKPAVYQSHLEALAPVVKGERTLYIRADAEQDILNAINLKMVYDLPVVIVGGAEAWLQASLLRKFNIPVILTRTHRLPLREDDAPDQPFRVPQLLYEAGVKFAFSMDIFWNERNLPFQAGTAVAYGLPYEVAIQSLTKWPAEILGIDARYGSIAIGKSGTLIVSEGDVLDMRTSIITHAFIDGRAVNLDNHQKQLYERYRNKP